MRASKNQNLDNEYPGTESTSKGPLTILASRWNLGTYFVRDSFIPLPKSPNQNDLSSLCHETSSIDVPMFNGPTIVQRRCNLNNPLRLRAAAVIPSREMIESRSCYSPDDVVAFRLVQYFRSQSSTLSTSTGHQCQHLISTHARVKQQQLVADHPMHSIVLFAFRLHFVVVRDLA
ncbi:hypothetical protein E2P81_ATG07493 [Venturia nashicola]|uniref:Uncharacterized protein n=1 Tax=Venturia nashicola TaxID=86259 RepID=A0A4Z1PFE6_9PEZI|nr:hypothetical protein E6O75_ATG07648 [Venturia nashicola]TLD32003.1 hypothetical protein E2P81_ATG07493 [Venturia nashicola]